MNANDTDDRLVVTSVALTRDLAERSLRAANARNMSRSAWLRLLIEQALHRAAQ
jgi:hypothetical protein